MLSSWTHAWNGRRRGGVRCAPPAPLPAVPRLPRGTRGGVPLPRPGRLRPRGGRRRRRALGRPRAADGGRGRARSRASRRRAERRGRRSARGPSPSRGRRRSSRASRPGSSAGRSSSCGRPWPRSGWRGSSRKSAGEPSCPCSGWPRTTTTSRRSARRASSTRAGRSAPCATPRATSPLDEPAWAIPLDDTISALVEELGLALPPALGRDEALGVVAECYRPGVTLSEAFARLVSRLLPELVVLDPSGRGAEAPDGPGHGARASRGLAHLAPGPRGRPALLAAGYHQQVPVRPGFLNLFAVVDGQRRALGFARRRRRGARHARAVVRRGGPAAPRGGPGPRGAPGALLRPLAQDALLPTAAYVGGPGRDRLPRADRALLRALRHPPPRPSCPGRASPSSSRRRRGPSTPSSSPSATSWATPRRSSRAGRARPTPTSRPRSRGRARRSSARWAAVEEALGAHDPTLRAATASARGRALHQVEGLHEKALRALKKRDQGRAERLRRTRDALLPGGSLQERGLGLVGALGRHGLSSRLRPRERSSTPSPAATRWSACEDRHRLLPDGGRLGGGGGRARQAARPPGPRHPRHLVPPALPPRRLPAEHLLPRGGRLELPPLRVPAARPRARGEDGGGDARARPRALPRPLRDPPRDRRVPRPADARRAAPRAW